MDVLNFFKKNKPPSLVVSPYEALSKGDEKRIKSMTIDLDLKAKSLTKKDISTWRQAWQMAIIPDNPRRYQLLNVYEDAMIDNHLTGCIEQRKNSVLQKAFKITDKTGKEKPELTELFENEWFKDFLSYSLDAIYYGHSLIEFGDLVGEGGSLRFEKVNIVPRAHVIPEFGIILKDPADDFKKGFSYKEGSFAQWTIEAGKSHDLGLLLNVSPNCLSKKNMLAFWDYFGEIFGMPIRYATVATRDKKEMQNVSNALGEVGAKMHAVFPEGTEIKFVESSRGDAFNVYDQRVIRANNEISKVILNQTMTIDDGASLSQSEVHLAIFKNVINKDADFLRDIINHKLIPFMVLKGFPIADVRFNWDETIDLSPEQQLGLEKNLLQNYDIPPEYFTEKYNIPIISKKEVNFSHSNDFFV